MTLGTKDKNFFKVPHELEEKFGDKLTPTEKYFLIMLYKLRNRFGDRKGWFWHRDKKFTNDDTRYYGFEYYGLSPSTCKRIRKKLKAYDLIETKYNYSYYGRRLGTLYRIKDETIRN